MSHRDYDRRADDDAREEHLAETEREALLDAGFRIEAGAAVFDGCAADEARASELASRLFETRRCDAPAPRW